MRRFFLVIVVLASIFGVSHSSISGVRVAYNISDSTTIDSSYVAPELSYVEKLAVADSLTGAKVIVSKDNNIAITRTKGASINGYRIRIFFDNSQSGRSRAMNAKEEFRELFSDTPVYITYQAPYFYVSVGDFMTHHEALYMLQAVIEHFPKSFITQQEIPVAVFGSVKPEEK